MISASKLSLSAEKDKEFFENKLSASSNAIENLNQQMNELSLKLDSAGKAIRTRKSFALTFLRKKRAIQFIK